MSPSLSPDIAGFELRTLLASGTAFAVLNIMSPLWMLPPPSLPRPNSSHATRAPMCERSSCSYLRLSLMLHRPHSQGRGLEQPNRYDAIYRLASANSALGPSQCSSSSSCSSQGMGALPTRSRKSLSAIVPGEISSNCSPLQMLAAMRALEKSGSHDADEFEKRKQDKNLDDLEGAGNQHRALSAPACTLGVIETGVLTRRRGSLVSLVNSRSSGGQSMVIETASSWEADDEVTPQRRREGGLSPFVLEDLRGTGTPSASRASSSNESFAPVSSNGSAQSRAGSVQSKEEVAQTVCVPPPRGESSPLCC